MNHCRFFIEGEGASPHKPVGFHAGLSMLTNGEAITLHQLGDVVILRLKQQRTSGQPTV